MIHCRYCKRPFQPTQVEQRFCSRNHSLAARRVRAKRRAREALAVIAEGGALCPRPHKRGYNSLQMANRTWEARQPTLTLYRCRCGALHFGHRYGPLRAWRF